MNGALVHLHLGVEGWLPMPCGVAAPVEVVVAAGELEVGEDPTGPFWAKGLGTWAGAGKIPRKRFQTIETVWGRLDNGLQEYHSTIFKQRFGF
jgi:hypothetical protein